MKFEQLYLFKEAAKYRSISVAAEKNFISQSAISYSIINLEKELGAELLRRSNTGVTPTPLGELLLEKAEGILKAVDDITVMAKDQRNAGEVQITCIPCICDWIIPATLKNLADNMAEILLSVNTAESNQVARDVSSGISKLGILIYYDELARSTDLNYSPLFRDEYVLYVGKNSPYWEKESITYDQLLKQPYIAYREEFQKNNGGLTNMMGTGSLPKVIYRTDNLDSIKSMIIHNNYVACFPKFMSEGDFYLQSERIRRIPISDKDMTFEVGYVESNKYKIKQIDKIVLNTIKKVVALP